MPPRLVVALVLAAIVLVERDVARRLSATFDELVDVGGGLHAVTHGEVTLGLEHAPLPKLVAGGAAYALGAREGGGAAAIAARMDRGVAQRVGAQELYARELLLRDNAAFAWRGARPGMDALIEAARAPMVLFLLLLLLVTWAWARELWGERGGLVALGLAATWPDLLGHGALIASDVPLAATGLLAGWALRCAARRGGLPRLVGLGLALGLLLASKLTAVFLALGLLLAALAIAPADPAPASPVRPWGQGPAARRAASLAAGAGIAILAALLVLGATFLGRNPVAAYRESLHSVYGNATPGYQAAFLGEFVDHAWGWYPVAFGLKAPLPTLALLLLAVWCAARELRTRAGWKDELLLHLPPLLLLVVTCGFGAQVGTRYLLPVVAWLFVSAGRLGRWAGSSTPRRLLLGALLGLNLATSVREHPFHGSSTNLLGGDPRLFHRLLDDSLQDWGQGLEALGEWQRREGVRGEDLIVIPREPGFEPAQLAAYGVQGIALPAGPAALEALFFPRAGKVYAVSAHFVSRGRLQERELRRQAPLGTRAAPLVLGGERRPTELVGGGLLIFDLR